VIYFSAFFPITKRKFHNFTVFLFFNIYKRLQPHEVCDSSEQAAHYHILGPKLGASYMTWHLAVTEERIIIIINVCRHVYNLDPQWILYS
jgi:hypothetical protein